MLEIHQFRHSAFCLKVRMACQAKNIPYKTIDISPGVDQISIFRLSGQKQVPVLVDGENVIIDSSEIIRYLDQRNSLPHLIPTDPQEAAQAHLIEDWADTTLANSVRSILIQTASIDPELRIALLPENIPEPFRKAMRSLPLSLLSNLSEVINQGERGNLLTSLEKISRLVESNPWLIGNSLSVADIAVAAQLSLLKFPMSSGLPLTDKGCPGFNDNPKLNPLFLWRDQLELSLKTNSAKI